MEKTKMTDRDTISGLWKTRITEASASLANMIEAPHLAGSRAAIERFFDEVEQLADEIEDDDTLRDRLAALLTGVAAGLKGAPRPGTLHDWSDLPAKAEAARSRIAELDAQLKAIKEHTSGFACWWAMVEAQEELCDTPIKDDATVLHFMGSGASTAVQAHEIRRMLGTIYGLKGSAT
jgi:hypothetical protein